MYKKIMIVDDSKVSRMIIKKAIKEDCPEMIFVEAAGAEEALDKLSVEEVEAAILDFHMPGMNGLELAEKIKALKPDMPITMLTANIQEEFIQKAVELGIGYMSKPPKKDKLLTFLSNE